MVEIEREKLQAKSSDKRMVKEMIKWIGGVMSAEDLELKDVLPENKPEEKPTETKVLEQKKVLPSVPLNGFADAKPSVPRHTEHKYKAQPAMPSLPVSEAEFLASEKRRLGYEPGDDSKGWWTCSSS